LRAGGALLDPFPSLAPLLSMIKDPGCPCSLLVLGVFRSCLFIGMSVVQFAVSCVPISCHKRVWTGKLPAVCWLL
jgi:hypothetical protein